MPAPEVNVWMPVPGVEEPPPYIVPTPYSGIGPMTLEQFMREFAPNKPVTDTGAFGLLPPEVQQAILSNPDVVRQAIASRGSRDALGWNQENNSIFSVGAEGGFNQDAYRSARWHPQHGLILDPSQYIQINDDGGFLGMGNAGTALLAAGSFFGAPMLAGALGGGLLGSAGAGAILGGGGSLLGGGDPLRGALAGGLGGLAGGYFGGAGQQYGLDDFYDFGSPNLDALSGSASTGATGGGMWDDVFGMDDLYDFGAPDLGAIGGDGLQYGLDDFYDFGQPDLTKITAPNWLKTLGTNLLRGALGGNASGGGTGQTQGGNILGTILNNPGQAAFNSLPFLLALHEANRQEDQIAPILARTSGLADQINPSAISATARGPYDRETQVGLDNLTTSLGRRGVLGSSFGNADITNFKTARDVGGGELATKALLGSIGTQGALYDQILRGTNVMNTNRNLLLGAGLNASGQLFQPQRDPFGLDQVYRRFLGLA